MEERRKYPRRRAGCGALFKGGTQALERARLRDISRSGLFIETQLPANDGDVVIVNLDAYDLGKDLSMRCQVVRSIPGYGMGLKITTTTDDEFLREWLSHIRSGQEHPGGRYGAQDQHFRR